MESKTGIRILEDLLRIILVVAIILSLVRYSWITVLISSLTLMLTYLPFWIENKYHINIPLDFEFAIILFVFSSLFLGEITKFYNLFWWWDIMLHAISAIAFGCIGFIIMFTLSKTNKISAKPIWIAIFAFCFALSIGAIWEILEFSIDQVLGMNMQKSGLIDTMWDLIVDAIGALISAVAGYAFMKGNQKSYLSRLIGLFIKDNPNLKI
ncbi:MAG: hypothetical protein KAS49_06045 [Candidatus Cloacimonetes bacterium]|nr:hypothetical protein [Candidatus Cloacimonadota bacterium]